MSGIKKNVLIIVLALMVISCAKLPVYQSKRIADKDKIPDLSHYDKKNKIWYDVFNDDTNVYIRIQSSNYYNQIKILKMGLTVWIDTLGKKNKDLGIEYPLPGSLKNSRQMMSGSGGFTQGMQGLSQLHDMFKLQDHRIRLIGMENRNGVSEFTYAAGSSDIWADITFDSSARLNYTAVVPISKIFADGQVHGRSFSVGIESGFLDVNKMREEMMSSGMHPGAGGRGGDMGGGMGGGGMRGGMGRPGGGPQGGGSQQQELSNPVKVWFSVQLN